MQNHYPLFIMHYSLLITHSSWDCLLSGETKTGSQCDIPKRNENQMASIALIRISSPLNTSVECVRLRFCLVVFFVRMCEWKACFRLIFPVPVSLNRFLAAEFVFILGITLNRLLFWPDRRTAGYPVFVNRPQRYKKTLNIGYWTSVMKIQYPISSV